MRKFAPAIAAAVAVLIVSAAQADSIAFFGNYTLSDSNADGFRESLMLTNMFGPHSGAITSYDPAVDALFGDPGMESILVAPLTLDSSNFVYGNHFHFDPSTYVGGFKIYDDTLAGTGELVVADLGVSEIVIDASTGSINSAFSINLTNVSAGAGYTPGDSLIIDSFLAATGGAANFTLQAPGDLSEVIAPLQALGGLPDYVGTYSGSAAAAAVAIPLPVAVWPGLGLMAGLAVVRQRRRAA